MKTVTREDHLLHRYDLSGIPVLDASSPRNRLIAEQSASEVRGVDIVFFNKRRPDRGRRPVGLSLDLDNDLTMVEEINADTLVASRLSYRLNDSRFFHAASVDDLTSFTYNTTTGVCTQASGTPFSGYTVRDGDVLFVKATDDDTDFTPGVYPVSATNGTTTITIPAGISDSNRTLTVSMLSQERNVVFDTNFTVGLDSFGVLVKSDRLYREEGAWPNELIGGFLTINGDDRVATGATVQVIGIATYGNENDALLVDSEAVASSPDNYKMSLTYFQRSEKTGVLVSDGRKFWLARGGSYALVFDLNDDIYLGAKWRVAKIASNRVMLVNEKFPPRIFHFDRLSSTAGEESIAGCVPPTKPTERTVQDAVRNCSWLMEAITSGGSLEAGSALSVLVRGVNYTDQIVSMLVRAVAKDSGTSPPYSATDNLTLTVVDDDRVVVFTSEEEDDFNLSLSSPGDEEAGFAPVIHSRITHIEIWRTQTAGGAYYRESTIEIVDREGNESQSSTIDVLAERLPASRYPVLLSEADTLGLPILTKQEQEAGGLPPICRDVASLEGTTLCFGRADDAAVNPVLYARSHYRLNYNYTIADGRMTSGALGKYKFRDGDQFVVVEGGYDTDSGASARVPEGVYDITSADNTGFVVIDKNLTSIDVNANNVVGYIRRPYTIDWSRIESDEEVWYSRTDQFNPEGFPPRILRLSSFGDEFRRAITIGDYVAVIMRDGVHILFKSGIDLLKNTVEKEGAGTPWPDSVVTIGEQVLWATNKGINILSTTPEADETGRRARVISIGRQFEKWFTDALLAGENIDAGVDVRYGLLRFRRKKSDYEYETLQYRLPQGPNDPGAWTFLDNDNGLRYANSTIVEEESRSTAALYSVDAATGAFFDCVTESADPYASFVTEDDLSDYEITTTSITHSGGIVFDSSMVGDIIEFSHGYKRVILTATERKLTFAAVPIDRTASFCIAPVPYRVRSGAMRGNLPQTLKTLVASTVRLLPGERDATRKVTVRSYQNFGEESVDTSEISVFTDTDSGLDSEQRVSSVQAAGVGIELEIESLGRNDFEIDSFDAVVREERSDRVSEVFDDG